MLWAEKGRHDARFPRLMRADKSRDTRKIIVLPFLPFARCNRNTNRAQISIKLVF